MTAIYPEVSKNGQIYNNSYHFLIRFRNGQACYVKEYYDTAYAQKAHDILLAWANTQTSFAGGESMLDLGDYAYRFVGGAEILR